jgi:hypothetical protein
MEGKKYSRGLDNRGNIEGISHAIKTWQRTTPVKVWVNAILTGSLRACSPQDKCKLP